jgi:hypothetical protein
VAHGGACDQPWSIRETWRAYLSGEHMHCDKAWQCHVTNVIDHTHMTFLFRVVLECMMVAYNAMAYISYMLRVHDYNNLDNYIVQVLERESVGFCVRCIETKMCPPLGTVRDHRGLFTHEHQVALEHAYIGARGHGIA